MPRIGYESKNFKPETMAVIAQADEICRDYASQGFDLTLRQLYYQFVARDLIPNTERSYKRLGSIVNDARMAGLLDWDFIVDRTRGIESRGHFDSPGDILDAAARSYARDLWAEQNTRVEVWIEKDALTGVIEPTCRQNDVTYFSCRGYTSQSEMWEAGQRIGRYIADRQRVVILHLGDHDPSGLDMSRDIHDRIRTFVVNDFARTFDAECSGMTLLSEIEDEMRRYIRTNEAPFELHRIALTMDQVEEWNPPPNPAKVTDSRFENYAAQYGDESWELDALDPATLASLIDDAIVALRHPSVWSDAVDREETERETVKVAARRWDDVAEFLTEGDDDGE